ncbi:MAG: patatin-like phospholipase family protein, partial [bacterium]
LEANLAAGRLRAVALTATSYSSGDTVTFVQGKPEIPTWKRARRLAVHTRLTIDHVLASSAIPLLFPAVRLGDEFYGDGSVRQTAPLAPAIHLGAGAVVAIAMRSREPAQTRGSPLEYPSAAEALGMVLDSIFLQALDADAERLERVNRLLAAMQPGVTPPDGLRPLYLLMLHPSQDLGTLATGHIDALPRTVRLVVESVGGQRVKASDFLSYLLFEPAYTSRLMDLGYSDVERDWPRIAGFLEQAGL